MTDYNYENTGDWDPNPYNCPNHPFNETKRDEYFKCPWTDKKCKKKSCYMCKDYGGLQI